MAAKYHHPSNLEAPLADPNPNSTMQNMTLNDDSEDTVSLCDLPVYGYDDTCFSNTESEDYSMKDDESFEFFSEEWLKNDKDLNFFPNKDIVFCGNLIIPEIPISRNTQEFKKRDLGSTNIFDRNYGSCRRNHGGKNETKRVFPASPSVKSRWYYYGFGLAGIPAEMDLSAIKSRQSRHQKSHSVGGGRKEESGGFRQGKRLGRLIRDLSCDGQSRPNSMVKPSLVYIPRG